MSMSAAVTSLTPLQELGIPVALVGAVFLAIGAEFQQHGVAKVASAGSERPKLGLGQVLALARRPSWLLGTVMLGLAIVLQLVSLSLAPLTVVQPLGAVALVITALVTARMTKQRLKAPAIRAIALCVGGVGLFVTIAAMTTTSRPITTTQLLIVVVILGVVLAALGVVLLLRRGKHVPRLFTVVAAGVLFGFVATLAKVLITRVETIVQSGMRFSPGEWLTLVCFAGLIVAALLGSYFVQTAYSTGSPEVVVAGLTVIDPLVGVTIGIAVLGEAASTPWWADAGFVIAGVLAVLGVVRLSRLQPPPVPPRRRPAPGA
ncbi:DMT family transporter [Curtobacterium sp. ISL-83]|uniref:DMT family transporter n=1 Tax=Curtobacterium sp. ISL-83 TaxID=2819145 RepID=UPI001BE72272|nr:DMT family transporter [Curtobacterium sp. ISL-83]MBT2503771.1 DMT family transporter [Curtobacterium sp. ISL-83]